MLRIVRTSSCTMCFTVHDSYACIASDTHAVTCICVPTIGSIDASAPSKLGQNSSSFVGCSAPAELIVGSYASLRYTKRTDGVLDAARMPRSTRSAASGRPAAHRLTSGSYVPAMCASDSYA